MSALILLTAITAVFAVLAFVSLRWGVDSREFTVDRFVGTALGVR